MGITATRAAYQSNENVTRFCEATMLSRPKTTGFVHETFKLSTTSKAARQLNEKVF